MSTQYAFLDCEACGSPDGQYLGFESPALCKACRANPEIIAMCRDAGVTI